MSSSETAAMADIAITHPYTCNTCQVAYRNIELQKGHMKSDWHRYNLKRRVASLPPISAEVFTEKVLQARAESSAEADKAYFKRSCQLCQKTYYSENSYQNHLSSQKHTLREAQGNGRKVGVPEDEASSVMSSTFSLGDPIPTPGEEVDSDAEEEFTHVVEGLQKATISESRPSPVKRPSNPQATAAEKLQGLEQTSGEDGRRSGTTTPVPSQGIPPWTLKSCLFCNYSSPTVPLNAHHMERFHGMFIPEKQYLVDLDGLLKQLQEKVHDTHECLYCGKTRTTTFAVQTHMRDVGHCKIPYTSEAEQLQIGDFYDFRGTYSDDGELDDTSMAEAGAGGGAGLGVLRPAGLAETHGGAANTEDDGWETDSSASSLDSEELTAVPADGHLHQYERLDKHPHHSRDDPRHHHQADGWHSHAHKHAHAVFYDEYELHLPSGKSVGHRTFHRYYRQNLHHHPTAEERAEQLALEDRRDPDAMDTDHGEVQAGNGRPGQNRAVVARGAAGMLGVADQGKRAVRRAEQRGRSLEHFNTKKQDWVHSKVLNNHKSYYYRFLGGG